MIRLIYLLSSFPSRALGPPATLESRGYRGVSPGRLSRRHRVQLVDGRSASCLIMFSVSLSAGSSVTRITRHLLSAMIPAFTVLVFIWPLLLRRPDYVIQRFRRLDSLSQVSISLRQSLGTGFHCVRRGLRRPSRRIAGAAGVALLRRRHSGVSRSKIFPRNFSPGQIFSAREGRKKKGYSRISIGFWAPHGF